MKFVPVGEGALIVYTMPIWATLLAWPLAGIRPKLLDIAALVLGVGGIAVLLGGNGFSFDSGRIIGIVLLFSAAILFAIGNILNRVAIADAAAGRGRLAGRARLPRDADPRRRVRAAELWRAHGAGLPASVYMTLVPMGLCYLTWFETLRRLPPSSASTGMLLVPLIGVISAALILGEPLGLREVVAMVLVLGGVTLALQKA